MDSLSWALSTGLFIIYIIMIFTVAAYTYRKGHTILLILGIFFPVLWLVGAILPAKRGSRYDVEMGERYRRQMNEMTR